MSSEARVGHRAPGVRFGVGAGVMRVGMAATGIFTRCQGRAAQVKREGMGAEGLGRGSCWPGHA